MLRMRQTDYIVLQTVQAVQEPSLLRGLFSGLYDDLPEVPGSSLLSSFFQQTDGLRRVFKKSSFVHSC